MTTIYLVVKHRVVNRFSGNTFIAHQTAFAIHDVCETKEEAKSEAKIKNAKAERYIYKVKQLPLKVNKK
jgi:hypothetical protein